ncbi:5408_t:CDS:2, partial [Acaulospora colombiana]
LSQLRNENNIITDDIEEIKTIVLNHFKETLKEKQFILPEEWKATYENLLVDPNLYNSATTNFTINELNHTLEQLSNNKMPGPSEIKYNVLTYMDDLALMGSKHEKLQKDMITFANFLKMNGIKCNTEKTKMIYTDTRTSPKRNLTFKLLGTDLHVLNYKDSLRYLGCYFSGFNSSSATINQLISDTSEISKAIIQTKGWNGPIAKQVAQWIIPAKAEYAFYISFLNKTNLSIMQNNLSIGLHSQINIPNALKAAQLDIKILEDILVKDSTLRLEWPQLVTRGKSINNEGNIRKAPKWFQDIKFSPGLKGTSSAIPCPENLFFAFIENLSLKIVKKVAYKSET